MNSAIRFLAASLVAFGALWGAAGAAAQEQVVREFAPEKQMAGYIQELDFGSNSMIFQGVRIHMAPEVEVEIQGSYGAFTMLRPGMKALVTYRVISASEREAVRIEQLPDNMAIEEA